MTAKRLVRIRMPSRQRPAVDWIVAPEQLLG
jgi:hypothetical protein